MQLVTGATGHIGNVLVRYLLDKGEVVRVLVRKGKHPNALEGLNVEFVYGDLLDPDSLAQALVGVDIVYHLAARVSIRTGPDLETEKVNLVGTRNLLTAAVQNKVDRFIFASSIYAMRMPREGVVDESCPFDPSAARGAYDRSKAAASLEVQRAAAEGLDSVLVCPTAVAGPYDFQPSEAGRGILMNMTPGIKFTVDGGYDFVDVRDVAQGLVLAAKRGLPGETYILGGERLTVREVAETIWDAAGGWHLGFHLPGWVADMSARILPIFSSDPIVTPYSLEAIRSNSRISHVRASTELGYRPRPARQAIVDSVRWFQNRTVETKDCFDNPARAAI